MYHRVLLLFVVTAVLLTACAANEPDGNALNTPPPSQSQVQVVSCADTIGYVAVPLRVSAKEFWANGEPDPSEEGYKLTIQWPRLAALLTQAILSAEVEAREELESLPPDIKELVEYDFPWELPREAGAWIYLEFDPAVQVVMAGEEYLTSLVVLYAAVESESATLFLELEQSWVSFPTTVDYDDIWEYMMQVVEFNKGE